MTLPRRRGKTTSGGDSKTKAKAEAKRDEVPPDQRPIGRAQADYLAEIADVPAEKLVGRPIAELDELLRWRIDPELLFFRRVCGRVVRRDPATGIVQGVPNATVHVEDTDCSFLGLFPVENRLWWWFWPISCRREVIATTTTDECGNFCVFIPRWDIDRILRFRLRSGSASRTSSRPNLRDLIGDIVLEAQAAVPGRPQPARPAVRPARRRHAAAARRIGRGPVGRGSGSRHVSLRTFGRPDRRADRAARRTGVHRRDPAAP